jgi:deazaflavin-dependent oxidoreductase (nitroreductase family)
VDRFLFWLTKGRVTSGIGTSYGKSILMLTGTGAKSGLERDVPLLCTPHDDLFVVIASQGGQEKNPAWYYNVKANPRVKVTFQGKAEERIARQVTGAERERFWRIACANYPNYDAYQARVEREIPLVVLERA